MYSRVYVEITNICNMNCSFCHGHSRKPKSMSVDEFSVVLEQLSGQTEYIYYHLMGEPLIHPDLPLFMKMSAQKGYRSIITTNGTLLSDKGDQLLSAGLHKINISLHSFEKNDNNMHRDYLKGVCEFADKASKNGTIVVLRFWNNGCEDEKNNYALKFLHNYFYGEWTNNTKGIRIRDKLYIEWGNRFEWPDKNAPIQSDKVFCYGMRDHFGILSDGSVVPCCLDSDGIIKLGNIFTQNISDILSTERAIQIKKGFDNRVAVEELCRRCAYAQRFV
ncbi:MAG: radical SAM protein [Ruminococcaceae bacterium]|nr:radical SAM protein [Oscillospiraceae bacterium]